MYERIEEAWFILSACLGCTKNLRAIFQASRPNNLDNALKSHWVGLSFYTYYVPIQCHLVRVFSFPGQSKIFTNKLKKKSVRQAIYCIAIAFSVLDFFYLNIYITFYKLYPLVLKGPSPSFDPSSSPRHGPSPGQKAGPRSSPNSCLVYSPSLGPGHIMEKSVVDNS